jgi:hypothetical protein
MSDIYLATCSPATHGDGIHDDTAAKHPAHTIGELCLCHNELAPLPVCWS